MDLIYLDYNCFQRNFDDQSRVKIKLEALSCGHIFSLAESNKVRLSWSFMHEDENFLCPFPWRKIEVKRLSSLCDNRIGPSKKIHAHAKQYEESANLSPQDAVHLACARITEADYLLSCDRQFLKRAGKLGFGFALMNPVEYVMEVLR